MQKVAVVGGGVSGLAAAWHLHTQSEAGSIEVHVFEADTRLGGHAQTLTLNTKNVTARDYSNGTAASLAGESAGADEEKKSDEDAAIARNNEKDEVDIDCGFMVFNDGNYPNMTRWFDALNVKGEDTDMSLSVSLDEGKKEWSSHSLRGLFANPLQAIKPEFYVFLRDLMRFNSSAGELLLKPSDDPARQVSIQEFLVRENYSEAFASYYLLPMMAALWSASVEDVMAFPASSLVEFMCNHKMLQLFNRPQYQTPAGRSIQYTSKMAEILGQNAHTGTPIVALNKTGESSYELFTTDNVSLGVFDHVVFACHSDQALKILSTDQSKTIDPRLMSALAKIEYGENVVYVHSDPELMPKRKAAWGSWNCMGKSEWLSTHRHVAGGKEREAMEGSGECLLTRFVGIL